MNTNQASTRPRRGGSRPRVDTVPMRRVNVMLDRDTIARAAKLGGANLSEGLRRAVAAATPDIDPCE